jgi:hypothetical protein
VNLEDRLDGALAGDMVAFAASPEVAGLVDTGDEVSAALATWTLDLETRARIYESALAMGGTSGVGGRIRALGLDRRMQAIAGGAVVAMAAAAAVRVAIARGRRHAPAPLGA